MRVERVGAHGQHGNELERDLRASGGAKSTVCSRRAPSRPVSGNRLKAFEAEPARRPANTSGSSRPSRPALRNTRAQTPRRSRAGDPATRPPAPCPRRHVPGLARHSRARKKGMKNIRMSAIAEDARPRVVTELVKEQNAHQHEPPAVSCLSKRTKAASDSARISPTDDWFVFRAPPSRPDPLLRNGKVWAAVPTPPAAEGRPWRQGNRRIATTRAPRATVSAASAARKFLA